MGNWRTVNIKGHMDVAEAKDAIQFLTLKDKKYMDFDELYGGMCDCFNMGTSLCGLGKWIKEDGTIDAIGNLYERDFDNDDIEQALQFLAKKYPSMELTLHSGSDWESLVCSATFHVNGGKVERCNPEIEEINKIPEGQIKARLIEQLYCG